MKENEIQRKSSSDKKNNGMMQEVVLVSALVYYSKDWCRFVTRGSREQKSISDKIRLVKTDDSDFFLKILKSWYKKSPGILKRVEILHEADAA